MRKSMRLLSGAVFLLLASACGGGGGGAGNDTSPAAVREALKTTNLSSAGFPWSAAGPGITFYFAPPGILKRWNLPIPVKTNGDTRVTSALNEIERQLGMAVFDRTSIAGTTDALVTRGLVMRLGKVVLIHGGNICADITDIRLIVGPGAPKSYPTTGADGIMSHAMYLDVDGATCRATQGMIIDAIGRAMGMGSLVTAFFAESDETLQSPLFWSVLRTIYTNPPGTPEAAIAIR